MDFNLVGIFFMGIDGVFVMARDTIRVKKYVSGIKKNQ